MRVQELVIDGFKSYATRTVISDWDDSFNCITGLNGSGKSNILDAICFVLGITTMSTVRAASQQDLIYKRGQAGVTKASVTLVFDNHDKSKSPLGFEPQDTISVTRQIVLGGTSKYLLNGHRAQQTDIKKLFQSVQLNIDNPNFLIMQGQVTKVLNMRPTEILALIEEAAGTRMFESRRENALKTMAKKDREIEYNVGLLHEEIEPKLNKLRLEKRDYLEFQQCQSQVERAEKLVLAHDYLALETRLDSDATAKDRLESEYREADGLLRSLEANIAEKTEEYEHLLRTRQELSDDNKLEKLETDHQTTSQEIARLQTSTELLTSTLAAERQKHAATTEQASVSESGLAEFSAQGMNFKAEYEKLQAEHNKAQEQVMDKRDLLSSLESGISGSGDRETGYASEAKRARATLADYQSRLRKAEQKKLYLERAKNSDDVDVAKQVLLDFQAQLDSLDAEILGQSKNLPSTEVAIGDLNDLQSSESEMQARVDEIAREIEQIRRQNPNLDFRASGFSKEQVKGIVAKLFSLKDNQENKALALEVTAGGRLHNVVVDNDDTGSKLLRSSQTRRITVLPLNRIKANVMNSEKVRLAKSAAPGQVDLALDILDYSADHGEAIRYVFGNSLICQDTKSAEIVTYNDSRIRAKSITWDGDVYEPQGTLSGGSKPQIKGVIMTIHRVNMLELEREELLHDLSIVQRKIQAIEDELATLLQSRQEMDLKRHERSLLAEKLAHGAEAEAVRQAESATADLEALSDEMRNLVEAISEQSSTLKQIELDAAEFSVNKDSKLSKLRGEIDQLVNKESELAKAVSSNRSKYQEVQGQFEQLQSDIDLQHEKLATIASAISETEQGLASNEAQKETLDMQLAVIEKALLAERERQRAANTELSQLASGIEAKKKQATEVRLELQTLVGRVEGVTKTLETSSSQFAAYNEKYPWLLSERHLLGEPNTPYDFHASDISQLRQLMVSESQRLSTLHKKVNPQVMSMIESVEKREEQLQTMIKQIEKDKRSIEDTVREIDGYKQDALINTWRKVSEDIGRIFGELLPGSSAKLEPQEGKQVAEGIVVHVRLGSVWKESLSELSGGQRSLVALSLILALLQFRPAPMYILDEVDAALDLHHTQNIGHIIKTKFHGSQFIVVSLKDGMFTNANKIFQTRFQEGTSMVSVL